jgi:hypothetical protein
MKGKIFLNAGVMQTDLKPENIIRRKGRLEHVSGEFTE